MRYALTLLFTLALCFAAQAIALRVSGGRFAKSESNFFSSVGRIQAGADGKAETMVLGSSITGRLPDRAQGFSGWANMGCDGGSAVDALVAMDAGILPVAPQLVIEANTLQLALDGKPTEIGQAMKGTWFNVGMKVPALSAYARPSAFFYSKLLARKIGGFDLGPGEDLGVTSAPQPVLQIHQSDLTPEQGDLIQHVSGILGRLRERGSKAVMVWLPPARRDDSPPPAWILEMARRSNVLYWDLGQDVALGTVTLTDGVHMDASSAVRTVSTLRKGLAR